MDIDDDFDHARSPWIASLGIYNISSGICVSCFFRWLCLYKLFHPLKITNLEATEDSLVFH